MGGVQVMKKKKKKKLGEFLNEKKGKRKWPKKNRSEISSDYAFEELVMDFCHGGRIFDRLVEPAMVVDNLNLPWW